MSPRVPTRARHWVGLLTALAVLGLACGQPSAPAPIPTKVIAFQGDTVPPSKGGLTIEIDMIFAAGVTNVGTVYPAEYATKAPFIHFQTAQVGTVLSYSLKVFGIEPGEKVSCLISINGLVVDKHTAKFPKPAVCSGPPV